MIANFWVKIGARKKWNSWQRGAISTSITKPATKSNEVAIKMNLEIPDSLFENPSLVANIAIPEDSVSKPEISADIQDNIAEILSEQLGIKISITSEAEDE